MGLEFTTYEIRSQSFYLRIGECPSTGAEVHCFQGMERYEDIYLYKIHQPTTKTTSVYVMHKFITIYYKLWRSRINTYYISYIPSLL